MFAFPSQMVYVLPERFDETYEVGKYLFFIQFSHVPLLYVEK